MTKLNDTHRILLAAAGQRDNASLLPLPASLTANARTTRVQAKLADNRQGQRNGARSVSPSLFAGRIVDSVGQPLIAVHATKGTTRYRYYVSRDLHEGKASTGMRLPAREVELAVTARLANFLADPVALIAASWLEVRPDQMAALASTCRGISISTTTEARPTVRHLVDQVQVTGAGIDISVGTAALAEMLGVTTTHGAPAQLTLHAAVRLTRTGKAMRLIQSDGRGVVATPNPSIVRCSSRRTAGGKSCAKVRST